MFILKFHNFSRWRVIKRVSPFHASHKMRVFRERENKNMKILQVSRLYSMQRTQRSILKTKIQPMAIAYPCFIEVRLWKSKKTNISPTFARNIPIAVRIANQTRRTVPVRIATALILSLHKLIITVTP